MQHDNNTSSDGGAGIFYAGFCYEHGKHGYEQDMSKAVECYRQAGAQGHAGARYSLGTCFEHGKGIQKDKSKATILYQLAANQGSAQAQFSLGMCYLSGTAGSKNIFKGAADWFTRAANQSHAGAQRELAALLEKDIRGMKKDVRRAAELYEQAAEQGDAAAQHRLGQFFEHGEGVECDFQRAAELFRKSADHGNSNAQYSLGLCYDTGKGVEKDLEKAAELFKQAADQGHKNARKRLADPPRRAESGNVAAADVADEIELASFRDLPHPPQGAVALVIRQMQPHVHLPPPAPAPPPPSAAPPPPAAAAAPPPAPQCHLPFDPRPCSTCKRLPVRSTFCVPVLCRLLLLPGRESISQRPTTAMTVQNRLTQALPTFPQALRQAHLLLLGQPSPVPHCLRKPVSPQTPTATATRMPWSQLAPGGLPMM